MSWSVQFTFVGGEAQEKENIEKNSNATDHLLVL